MNLLINTYKWFVNYYFLNRGTEVMQKGGLPWCISIVIESTGIVKGRQGTHFHNVKNDFGGIPEAARIDISINTV